MMHVYNHEIFKGQMPRFKRPFWTGAYLQMAPGPQHVIMLVGLFNLWRIHTRWISSYINRPNCYVCTYTHNSY